MKKYVIPSLLFLQIGIVIVVNLFLPFITLFFRIEYSPGIIRYILVIFTYISVILILWQYKNDIATFNLEKFTLIVLILVSFIRSKFSIPFEFFFKSVIGILGIGILVFFVNRFKLIPMTKGHWILLSLLSCLLIIPIAKINSLQSVNLPDANIYSKGFVWNALRNLLYGVSFIGPFEEILIRGILWGQLRLWNWSEKKIFWVQAFLFWFLHIWQVFTMPLAFLFSLPIMTLVFSLLVKYSKQVFPSIVVHSMADALGPLIVFYFLSNGLF